jgi:hypothetical protein
MTYDLTAIYLCHSYYKGLLTRIPSAGHTNMNRTNGAGKSTTLQLIPIFYGKNPEELVNRAASNDSFVDHYLPNSQSMLVFQYIRSSGPCCAVMYRLGDEGRAAYRFVGGAAEDTLFTPEAIKAVSAGLSAKEFLASLTGVEVSNQITTIKEYRAILQNDKALASQKEGPSEKASC